MRIAFLTRNYGQPKGGSEAYINNLARNLIDLDHELHVFTDVEEHCGHPQTLLHIVPIPRHPSFVSVLAFARQSSKQLRRMEKHLGAYDVVAGFGKVTDFDVYRAGGGVHRMFVKTKRWPLLQEYVNPLHRTIIAIEDRIYSLYSDTRIICNSKMVKNEIQEVYRLPDHRFHIIYNGVDTNRFNPRQRKAHRGRMREELNIPDDAVVLLFVGTGWARKGLDTLLEAWSVLLSDAPEVPWYICVVGQGNEQQYRKNAVAMGIDEGVVERQLLFTGYTTEPEKYYATADIAVLPSLYDAGANVVQEAMASAMPIITSSTNGTSELVQPAYGQVIDGNLLDPEELANAIQRFQEPAARQTAGAEGRKIAERLRIIDNAKRTLKVYHQAAAQKRR